jgi:metallo-beta-lactamase class B
MRSLKITAIAMAFFIGIGFLPATEENRIRITDNLELLPVSESVYIHVSYHDLRNYKHVSANGLVYVDQDKAFVMDTTWADEEAQALINWLLKKKITIQGVVATHWHIDCMGGLDAFHKAGIGSYGHELTRETARNKKLPVPQNGFTESLFLRLNGKTIQLYYPGPGHTKDNIVIWLPDEKILFGGCLLKALEWKGLGFIGDADLGKWPSTLEMLLKKFPDSCIVVPGHGRPGDLSLIHHTSELLKRRK